MLVMEPSNETSLLSERLPVPVFEPGTTLHRIQADSKIRVGVATDLPGFSYRNPKTNVLEGLDVTFSRWLAQAIFGGSIFQTSRRVEFVETAVSRREDALRENEVDVVISAYAVTPIRRKLVDFTEPYFGSALSAMVRIRPEHQNLSLESRSVVVVDGSVGQDYLKRNQMTDLQVVASSAEMIEAMMKGKTDAIITAKPVLHELIMIAGGKDPVDGEATSVDVGDGERLVILPTPLESLSFAVGLRKGQQQMREFLNRRVEQLVKHGFMSITRASMPGQG